MAADVDGEGTDMPDREHPRAGKLLDLPPHVIDFLEDLRREEVETIRWLSQLPMRQRDRIVDVADAYAVAKAGTRLAKWVFFGMIGTFVAIIAGWKSLMEMLTWFRD